MLRKARLIAPLVRSLLLGAALVPGLVLTGSVLVGCEDENDPMTHVKKLKEPAEQRQAIKQLLQMYADAESKDKKDPEKPNVKKILDVIMVPLVETCLDEKVKDADRSKLVKFMADTRDDRARPCLKKTLDDYKPDTNEDDVTNVLLNVAATKDKELLPSVMKVLKTTERARPKGQALGPHINKSLRGIVDKSVEDELLKMLEPEIEPNTPAGLNQLFWQQTAAWMLGHIQSEKAIEPLLKILLTPQKGPVQGVSLLSLVKIGKPAVPATEKLLKGEDAELVKYSEEQQLKIAEKDTNGKIPETDRKSTRLNSSH